LLCICVICVPKNVEIKGFTGETLGRGVIKIKVKVKVKVERCSYLAFA
jgi:hypothetical protein